MIVKEIHFRLLPGPRTPSNRCTKWHFFKPIMGCRMKRNAFMSLDHARNAGAARAGLAVVEERERKLV